MMTDTATWLIISFGIFVVAAWFGGRKPIAQFFDNYAVKIREELSEATKIHDEANKLLAETRSKHANAVKEIDGILAQARQQSQLIRGQAENDLEILLKRREQQAMDRIRIFEEQAMSEIRAQTVDTALKAAEHILRTNISAQQDQAYIDQQTERLAASLKKVA
jgi:F-type H+-transporting ATPase subunit b